MSKAHRSIVICCCIVGVPLVSACTANPTLPPPPAATTTAVTSEEYVIGRDDLLQVRFMYNASFDQTLTVQPDGRIALPMVGAVVVSGQTPSRLSAELSRLYEPYLQRPDISVLVKSADSQRAFIGGEVQKASVVNLTPGMTISSALIAAGGLKDSADSKRIVLLRRDGSGNEQAFNVNVASALNGSDLSQNIVLQPYDIVVAPKSDIANVNLFVQQYIKNNLPVGGGFGVGIN
jgi:protein involved in polysaccharide export with SLBB domain